jgi:hypothetical protein
MTSPRLLRGACLAAMLSALTTAAPSAWAVDKAQCASAYEAAQERRSQTKLREARDNLLVCVQAACPAFIKKDCSKWLSEVEAALPTVVLSARAKGKDLTDVTVKVDGDDFAGTLDGKALPVDPGPHTFTFESEEFGSQELRYVVKEGQKSQAIEVDFAPAKQPSAGEEVRDSGPSAGSQDMADDKTLAYVLLGVGVVGIGGFAYFGLTANSDKDELACADTKTCSDDDLAPIRQKYLIADISLGVGLVSLGVGTYLLLSGGGKTSPAPAEQSANVRFDVMPRAGGGFATLSGSF